MTTVARVGRSSVEPVVRWFHTLPLGWLIALSVFSLLFVRPAFLGITLHALFLTAVLVRELMAAADLAADLLAAHRHFRPHGTTERHGLG